jgi:hypothetical protein
MQMVEALPQYGVRLDKLRNDRDVAYAKDFVCKITQLTRDQVIICAMIHSPCYAIAIMEHNI